MGTRGWARIDNLQIETLRIRVVLRVKMKAWWDVKWNSLFFSARQMERLIFPGFEVTKSNLMRKLDLHVQIDSKECHSESTWRSSFSGISCSVTLVTWSFVYLTFGVCMCAAANVPYVLFFPYMNLCPLVVRPCLCTETCADTSLHITPPWSQEVIMMSAVKLWGMEMLSALEEWHIEHKEVWDIQGLRVIKQHCGSHHCPLHSHSRHKSLASGVWRRCHLEKCNVKTMSFQQFLQNFPSAYTREHV